MVISVSQKEKAFVLEAVKQGYLNKQRAEKVFQRRQRILEGAAEKQKLAETSKEHRQKLLEQVQNDQKKAKVWQLAIALGFMTSDQARGIVQNEAVRYVGNGTLDIPSIARPELTLDFMGINIEDMIATAEKSQSTEEIRPEDRYEFIRKLGAGGMGEVGLYKDLEMGREVAIKKILATNKNLTEEHILRFQREMEITGKLYRHPGIIQIFDFGRDSDSNLYIAMEVVHGRELSKILSHVKGIKKEGQVIPRKYSLNNMMKYFVQTLEALQFMHSNDYVHRDLKPDNIMIDEELGQAKIMDLGLAKQVSEQEPDRKSDMDILLADSGKTGVYKVSAEALKQLGRLPKKTAETLEGQIMGTPSYMSPDQIKDSKSVDQRADIFSMGIILYELLTGQKPHKKETPLNTIMSILKDETIPPIAVKNTLYDVPKELSAICVKALSKDPKYRYKNAKEFLDDIQAYMNHEAVSVYQDNFWEKIVKWGKRKKKTAGMLIGAAMLLPLALGGVGIVRAIGAQNELHLEKDKTVAERVAKEEAEKRAKSEKGRADAEAKAKEEAERRAEAEKGRAESEKDRADLAERLITVNKNKAEALRLNNDAMQKVDYARNIRSEAEKNEVLREAMSVLEKAKSLDDQCASIYHNLGVINEILGNRDVALQQYDQALTVDPNYGKSLFGRATIRVQKSDLDGAIQDYEKAKEILPLLEIIHSNLSVCYIRKGNLSTQKGQSVEAEGYFHKAIQSCDAALAINARYGMAHRNKGESYMYLGEYRRAEENLNNAVTHGNIYSHLLLARNMIEAANAGNPLYENWRERAKEHCARAVKIDPRLAEEAKGILEKIR